MLTTLQDIRNEKYYKKERYARITGKSQSHYERGDDGEVYKVSTYYRDDGTSEVSRTRAKNISLDDRSTTAGKFSAFKKVLVRLIQGALNNVSQKEIEKLALQIEYHQQKITNMIAEKFEEENADEHVSQFMAETLANTCPESELRRVIERFSLVERLQSNYCAMEALAMFENGDSELAL